MTFFFSTLPRLLRRRRRGLSRAPGRERILLLEVPELLVCLFFLVEAELGGDRGEVDLEGE